MDSIGIRWKKAAPDSLQILNKKMRPNKKTTRKNHHHHAPPPPPPPAPKRQEPKPIIEQRVPKLARTNKQLSENQPYAPLQTISFSQKSSNISSNAVPILRNNHLCSTRAAIATFIIIIILILAAGISVGVVFAAVNSKNSSGNGSNNNNQNLFATVSSGTLTSSLSVGSQTGSACTGYTTINDPTRSATLPGSSSACDSGALFNTASGGAWIRFVGAGGTKITSSPAGSGYCGAFLTTWFNGTLPGSGSTINGLICIESYAGTCYTTIDITITECSGFYVYFLPPVPLCNTRYCTA